MTDLLEALDDKTRARLSKRQAARRPLRRGWLLRRGLMMADIFGLSVAFGLAMLLDPNHGAGGDIGLTAQIAVFVASLPGWVIVAKMHGLYDRDERRADNSTTDDIVGVFHLVTVGAWLLAASCLVTGVANPELVDLVTLWLAAIALVPLTRKTARSMCSRRAAYAQNTVIVGAGQVGQLLARKFIKHPEYGINLVGFVDRRPRERRSDLPEHLTILGPPERLREIVARLDVERVVFSFSDEATTDTLQLIRELNELNVHVDVVPRLFELLGPNVGIHMVEGTALVSMPPSRLTPIGRLIKRAIDIVGASAVLILAAPLMALLSWCIKRDSPGPVFFRQTRVGYRQQEFTVLKFRTMKADTDSSVHREYISRVMSAEADADENGLYKLERADSVTRVGCWLRKTSLDELPQLLNVLKGDMSLVGPRPCIPYEVEGFRPYQFERFLVPQGMTGLWQVTARANATFSEALDMDVAYVRSWSVALDLRLLLRTPLQLLRQRRATS